MGPCFTSGDKVITSLLPGFRHSIKRRSEANSFSTLPRATVTRLAAVPDTHLSMFT